jgi:hypothetical protein
MMVLLGTHFFLPEGHRGANQKLKRCKYFHGVVPFDWHLA